MPSKVLPASGTRTRIMLASLSQARTPGKARKAGSNSPRSRRSVAACSAKTSACSSANRAHSQLSTLML